ncbi:MAG: tetratricopeptide repeat protein, partial [Pseudomonadota bacterium]
KQWLGRSRADEIRTGEPAPVSRLVVLTPQPADDQSPAWLGQALGQLLARQLESRFQISAQADVQLASWVGPARPEATWLQDDAGGGQLVLTGKYRKADAAQQIRFTLAAQHGAGVRWQAEFLIAEGAVIDELTARSAELTQNLGETLQLAPRVAAADAGEHLPAAAAGLSRVYAEAQHDLSRFDLQQAARRVSGGLKETPEDALLWHLKSRVEEGRGRPRAARRAAARALELSGDLPRRQQLEIQARQAQLSGQPQEAGRLLEALSTFFPETLSYRLDLARALNAQGELAPALAVLDNLQTLPLSGLEQQLGKLLHAELSIGHGQFDRARGQLPELLNYANTNALLPMQAQLLRLRARQRYYADDNLAGAVDDLSAAGALYQTLGDRRGQADCATALANYARHHGDLDGAETLFAGALKIAETLGDTDLINRTINGRANALSGRGLYREATALYEDVLARVVALGDKHLTALMHHNIGVTALKLGELDHGFEALERSRAMNETAGNPFGMMLVHYGLGNYRWERAEMDQAQTHYEAARDLAARHNSPAWERFSDLQLAQIERWRGATAAATLRAQRSFDGFLAGAQEDRARRAARVLAAILIDHGAPDRARALTRDWADTTNSRELLLLAMLDVAQHPSTAAEQAEAALDAVSDLQHLPERLEVMTGVADVLARAGERAPARELLTQVRGEAQSHGLVRVDRAAERLERRLAESPPVGERVADPTR